MNVLGLFDGMSCGQIALNRAGINYDKYFASEIDKYAIIVTQANYPNTIQLGDIKKWKEWKLPKIDLLVGGSPCQSFSRIGKQLNFKDPRSKLFFIFVDILKYYKPKYFLFENVKMKKEYLKVINEYLGINFIEINSSLVSAQRRKRCYWTNIPGNSQRSLLDKKKIKLPKDKGILLKDILEDKNNCKESTIRSKSKCIRSSGRESYDRHEWDSIDNSHSRKLTPLECERLQTISNNYSNHVSNNQRYKMLGNGWTVDVIVHFFQGLIENKEI